MGLCCSTPPQSQQRPQLVRIQQESQPNQDVNLQYSIQFKILKEETGEDFKKTKAYISYISEQELQKFRNHFWETRVEGQQEIWQILRNVVKEDIQNAKAMIEAMDIKLINNSLQSVYDHKGKRYDIPIFCINDPQKYDVREQIKSGVGLIPILVRSPKFNGQDLKIEIDLQNQVEVLKNQIKEQKQVKTLRLFFGGMELKDKNLLSEYNLKENDIVIAFL
ncbi:Ubiquitin domain-containing protein 2 [Paramecium bursaria]